MANVKERGQLEFKRLLSDRGRIKAGNLPGIDNYNANRDINRGQSRRGDGSPSSFLALKKVLQKASHSFIP